MAIRRIVQTKLSGGSEADEVVLRAISKPVDVMTDDIRNIIIDLRDTLWAYPFSVGLSAPQIGQELAISVINPSKESREDDIVLINPEIISLTGKKDIKHESCMSVWGEMGDVERRYKVMVKFRDEMFNLHQNQYTGFVARVIQHEIDHLNGILYSDKLVPQSKLQHADFFDEYSIIKDE